MTTYISILRGINVSGQKLIKMDALKKMYETMHFVKVKTYIQSGNVIFQCPNNDEKALAKQISQQIQQVFGFEVPVIVFDTDTLKKTIDNCPWAADPSKDSAFMHVTFLAEQPAKVDVESISQKQSVGEAFNIGVKAIYLYCPNGYGNTKLNNNFLENKLKVSATTRNWKTCNELLNIADNMQYEKQEII